MPNADLLETSRFSPSHIRLPKFSKLPANSAVLAAVGAYKATSLDYVAESEGFEPPSPFSRSLSICSLT